jgi:hypothetical protein
LAKSCFKIEPEEKVVKEVKSKYIASEQVSFTPKVRVNSISDTGRIILKFSHPMLFGEDFIKSINSLRKLAETDEFGVKYISGWRPDSKEFRLNYLKEWKVEKADNNEAEI